MSGYANGPVLKLKWAPLSVVAYTTVLVVALAGANYLNPVVEGLSGTYYSNANWTSPAALTSRDSRRTPSD